jgi:hypothetical protein
MRPLAIHLARFCPHYEADDFLSIAMEQVLHVARKGKRDEAYLYGVARRAMWYARARLLSHDISLDAYLYDDRTGLQHELADSPAPIAPENRHRLSKLLATIPLKHRLVLCAAYSMEDEHGGLWTQESVCECFGLSRSQFSDTKRRAEAMLWRNSQKLKAEALA